MSIRLAVYVSVAAYSEILVVRSLFERGMRGMWTEISSSEGVHNCYSCSTVTVSIDNVGGMILVECGRNYYGHPDSLLP